MLGITVVEHPFLGHVMKKLFWILLIFRELAVPLPSSAPRPQTEAPMDTIVNPGRFETLEVTIKLKLLWSSVVIAWLEIRKTFYLFLSSGLNFNVFHDQNLKNKTFLLHAEKYILFIKQKQKKTKCFAKKCFERRLSYYLKIIRSRISQKEWLSKIRKTFKVRTSVK